MEAGKSEDDTEMDVLLTGTGMLTPEETVGLMERGGDIGLMNPGANPQLRERSPMRERRATVTGENISKSKLLAFINSCYHCTNVHSLCLERFLMLYGQKVITFLALLSNTLDLTLLFQLVLHGNTTS